MDRTMRLMTALFILLALSGCAQQKEQVQVKNTVVKYDALLAEGYRKLNMGPLFEAATKEIAEKAYYHMAALGEARVKMDMTLKSIMFSDLEISQGKAGVRATEIWDYSYISLDTGKPVFNNSVTYKMKYILEKSAGKWLITGIIVEKADEKKDSRHLFQRPPGHPPLSPIP